MLPPPFSLSNQAGTRPLAKLSHFHPSRWLTAGHSLETRDALKEMPHLCLATFIDMELPLRPSIHGGDSPTHATTLLLSSKHKCLDALRLIQTNNQPSRMQYLNNPWLSLSMLRKSKITNREYINQSGSFPAKKIQTIGCYWSAMAETSRRK